MDFEESGNVWYNHTFSLWEVIVRLKIAVPSSVPFTAIHFVAQLLICRLNRRGRHYSTKPRTPPSLVPFPLGQFNSHLFCWKRRPKTAHNALNLKKILFPPRVIGRLLICLPSLGLTAHSAKKLKWGFNNFSFWNDWKIKISRRKLHHLREFQTILKKGHLMKNFQISVPSQTWSNRV